MREDWEPEQAITHHQFLLHCLELFFTDKIFILENHLQQSLAQRGPRAEVRRVTSMDQDKGQIMG
jgi:hypothetical protein